MIIEPNYFRQISPDHSVAEVRHKENSNASSSVLSLQDETKYSYCDCLLYPFKKIAEFFQWIFCNLFRVKSSETKSKTESSESITEESKLEKEEVSKPIVDVTLPKIEVNDQDVLEAINRSRPKYRTYYEKEMPQLSAKEVENIKYLLTDFISLVNSYCASKDKENSKFSSFYFEIVREKPNVIICKPKFNIASPQQVGSTGQSAKDKPITLSFHISILMQILKECLYLNANLLDLLGTKNAMAYADFYIIFNGIKKDRYDSDHVPFSGSFEDIYKIDLPNNKQGLLSRRGFF